MREAHEWIGEKRRMFFFFRVWGKSWAENCGLSLWVLLVLHELCFCMVVERIRMFLLGGDGGEGGG